MKRYFLLLSMILVASLAFGQDSLPVYKRFPTVPPFKIINVGDSSFFQKSDLKKKKATLVMIFSPDCDHCQHATRDLLANAARFKKVQIVMAAYAPFDMVYKFYKDFGIDAQPNITMGIDQGYFLTSFYSIKNFPSVFLYDKKGTLTGSFEKDVDFSSMDVDF